LDPQPAISGDTTFCVGGVAIIGANTGFVSYSWSTGDTTEMISVSSPGNYTVSVTDNNGCINSTTAVVGGPYQETLTIAGSLAYCAGFSTQLDAGNDYTSYAWSSGDTTQTITVNSPGMYMVTVTDTDGCIAMDTVDVIESTSLQPQISGDTAICSGGAIMLNGGSGFTEYQWSTGDTTQMIMVDVGSVYALTVYDASGCSGETSFEVDENPPVFATVAPFDSICNATVDGSVLDLASFVTGGDTGGSWTEMTGSGVSLTNLSNVDFNGVTPGMYQFAYTTNSAVWPCVDSTYRVDIRVKDCACPSAIVDPGGSICNDNGMIDLNSLIPATTVQGGNWSIITDPGGPSPATISGTTFDAVSADGGNYILMYTVSGMPAGCPDTSTTLITVEALPFSGFSEDAASICIGEDSTVALVSLLTDEDDGGFWLESSLVPSSGGAFDPGTGTFSSLNQNAGTYTFDYIIDGGTGPCPDVMSTVEVVVENVPQADAGSPFELTCENPSATLGGPGTSTGNEFSYLWTAMDGSVIQDSLTLNPDINRPGTYTLMVVNNNTGCISFDDVVITSNGEIPTSIAVDLFSPVCEGDPPGSINILGVTGGTPNYSYSLNGDTPTSQSQFSNLAAGNYNLQVIDAGGCTYDTSFVIGEASILTLELEGEVLIAEGDTLTVNYVFNNGLEQPDSLVWRDEEGTLLCTNCNPLQIVPTISGEVIAFAYNEDGCEIVATLGYIVKKERNIYIPNVFSPNGDGNNDWFTISSNEGVIAEISSLQVFTRWGELVFNRNNFPPGIQELGWDGTFGGEELNPGVYVFHANIIYVDGFEDNLKGDVTIIR
ncbi:MAG: gliding motility-associated C-terminal domain-containing protein, partial [Saprospiraceae bacterium]|nr:gliding motility-associated C-terminal domain-containing protein [Saprospiraceae bacterium]